MTDLALRSLIRRTVVAVAVAVFVVVADGVVNLRVNPVMAVTVAVAVAVVSWLFSFLPEPAPGGEWEQPHWKVRTPHLHADVRTRRLAALLSHAQPGRAFDTGKLAAMLSGLTEARLVASGRTAAADPWDGADQHLSPALLAVVRADGHAPALTRKALHAHLKEIDSL